MSESARIMIYSQDSYGLGHLRRTTNVANALVAQRKDLTVLIAVDSPVAPFFELSERIDFIKLPTVVKVDAGVFRAGQLLTDYDLVNTMRSNLLREVVRQFHPHVVLVDHMPAGANRELLPSLKTIRGRRFPTKIVLGLRDIIDDPPVTCEVWRKEQVYETMQEFYDCVLVYGSADVFPTAEKYQIPPDMCERLRYCGYVCNMDPVRDATRIRAKLGVDAEPIVTVMAGGGWDAFVLMQTFLGAVARLRAEIPFAALMVTGPLMPEWQRKQLRDRARELGVHVRTSVGDNLSQINAADVVVSMAGYNTVSEILRFGKQAILVPRPGPSAEQGMRARLLAERGLVHVLEQSRLSDESLAEKIREALQGIGRQSREFTPGLNGIAVATETLLSLLPPPGSVSSPHVQRHDSPVSPHVNRIAADGVMPSSNDDGRL